MVKEPIGTATNGQPVYLKDISPRTSSFDGQMSFK